jgi:hypothetical protein
MDKAHLQIREWLSRLPGVVATEVATLHAQRAIVIHYDPALLSTQTRAQILDRLTGFPVCFEPAAPTSAAPERPGAC